MRLFATAYLTSVCFLTSVDAQQTVDLLLDNSQTFLSCNDLAETLDMEFQVVTENKLATFCSKGKSRICIPVQLTASSHRVIDKKHFLLLQEANSIFSIDVTVANTVAQVTKTSANSVPTTKPTGSYNAQRPDGRGFEIGQTVPDIPLIDMNGDEVRFSNYLGKRYVLYCWASW